MRKRRSISGSWLLAEYAAKTGAIVTAEEHSVIGGLGSLPGAVVGGLLLGLMETMVSAYVSAKLRDMIAYLAMIVILAFIPNGLVGKSVKEKL